MSNAPLIKNESKLYYFDKDERKLLSYYWWINFCGTIVGGIGIYIAFYMWGTTWGVFERFLLMRLLLIGYIVPALFFITWSHIFIPTELKMMLIPKKKNGATQRTTDEKLYGGKSVYNGTVLIFFVLLLIVIGGVASTFMTFYVMDCSSYLKKWCYDDTLANPNNLSKITHANDVISHVNDMYLRTYLVQAILGYIMFAAGLVYIIVYGKSNLILSTGRRERKLERTK